MPTGRMERISRTERSAGRLAGLLAAALALGVGAAGCGGDDAGTPGGASRAAVEPPKASSAERRSPREDAIEARRLIDRGRADLARPLIEALEPELGAEGPLLVARLKVLEGDASGWIADVERARRMDPRDPRVFATAAELYAAIGRPTAARDEIVRAVELFGGRTPEITRATGVLAIVTPGQVKAGLDLLLAAEREDPGLPFLGRPLGQAYMLMAKDALGAGSKELALDRIRKSLEYDPDDPYAREFHGTALLVAGDYDRALPLLQEASDSGLSNVELPKQYWMGGLKAQLEGRVDVARERYLRARELGSLDVNEGVARTFLDEQATTLVDGAIGAARTGEAERATKALEEALRIAGPPLETYRAAFAARIALRAEEALDAGELEVAGRYVDLAIEADRRSSDTALVTGRLHHERALAALAAQDVPKALEHARIAAAANPDQPLRWRLLGELQQATGDWEGASASLAKARDFIEAEGGRFPLGDAVKLADCQVLADRDGEAATTLERALQAARAVALEGVDPTLVEEAEAMLRVLRKDG